MRPVRRGRAGDAASLALSVDAVYRHTLTLAAMRQMARATGPRAWTDVTAARAAAADPPKAPNWQALKTAAPLQLLQASCFRPAASGAAALLLRPLRRCPDRAQQRTCAKNDRCPRDATSLARNRLHPFLRCRGALRQRGGRSELATSPPEASGFWRGPPHVAKIRLAFLWPQLGVFLGEPLLAAGGPRLVQSVGHCTDPGLGRRWRTLAPNARLARSHAGRGGRRCGPTTSGNRQGG